jgi:hypothetical protein
LVLMLFTSNWRLTRASRTGRRSRVKDRATKYTTMTTTAAPSQSQSRLDCFLSSAIHPTKVSI